MQQSITVAIVDDEDEVLDLIEQILREDDIRCRRFHTAEDLLREIGENSFDIIISDLMLPGISGIDLLNEIHIMQYDIPVVIITGYASLDSAIEAVNKGAFYYIKKPFNIEEIRFIIKRFRQRQDLIDEIATLKKQVDYLEGLLESKPGEEIEEEFIPQVKNEMNRVFAAIEHLGKLRQEGLISNDEFGEYKGKILKRIV